MFFWILLTLISVSAGLLILLPLFRQQHPDQLAQAPDTGKLRQDYQQQVAQIAQDQQSGMVTAAEAQQLQADLARRFLSIANDQTSKMSSQFEGRRGAHIIIGISLCLIAGGSLIWYGQTGMPGYPAIAFDPVRAQKEQIAKQQQQAQMAQQQSQAADIRDQLNQKRAYLAGRGDDLGGWEQLGISYLQIGAWEEAQQAFGHLISKSPDVARYHALRGEALTRQNQGIVSSEALELFLTASRLTGEQASYADFFIGLAKAQAGALRQALDHWIAVDKAAEETAPWRGLLRQNIEKAASELSLPVGEIVAALPPLPTANMRANSSVSEEVPDIQAMVQNLADRLTEDGGEIAEWRRLARSYEVLGQGDQALATLGRSIQAYPADPGLTAEWLRQAFVLFSRRQEKNSENWQKMADRAQSLLEREAEISASSVTVTIPELLWYQAVAAEKLSHYKQAFETLTKLKSYLPEDVPQRKIVDEMIKDLQLKAKSDK